MNQMWVVIWVWVWVLVVGFVGGWISLSMVVDDGRRLVKVVMRVRWGSGGVSLEAGYWMPKME